jgi:hypothetical protein
MVEPVKVLEAAADLSFQEVSEEARTVAVARELPEALALAAKVAAVRFMAEAAAEEVTSAAVVAVQTPTPAAAMPEEEAEALPLPTRP